MLLLTGATGRVGSALLPRLTARGEAVRCLVRDPRRLGPARVRVQIALGDLADPASFRHALRGVRTVVHLAGAWRDQPHGRAGGAQRARDLAAAARRRARRRRALRLPQRRSAPTPQHPLRAHRAKALAEEAVADAALATTTFRVLADLRAGRGAPAAAGRRRRRARAADRRRRRRRLPAGGARRARADGHARHELAGPQELSWRGYRRAAAGGRRARGRPAGRAAPRAARATRRSTGPAALLTWDEAARATAPLLTPRGTADADALGVTPRAAGASTRHRRSPGRCAAHGRAVSSCAATCSSVSSPSGWPTSCTAVGSPSSPKPTGSEIAGWPVTLNSAVYGAKRPARRRSSSGSSPQPCSSPIGSGRSASTGVSSRS